jgi:hypothetical protein
MNGILIALCPRAAILEKLDLSGLAHTRLCMCIHQLEGVTCPAPLVAAASLFKKKNRK